MGYFTSLIEKYLPSKNDVQFVRNVPTPVKPLEYMDSMRTNSMDELQLHNVHNVHNVHARTNRTSCEQAHETHNVQQNLSVFNAFEAIGTKRQNEHAKIEAIAKDIDFEELRYFFEERAGICEYDGSKPQPEAELLALKDAVILYLEHRNPELLQAINSSLLGS